MQKGKQATIEGVGVDCREKETRVRVGKLFEQCAICCSRWSKPHVATPALHGVLQLRKLLKTGIVLLDLEVREGAQLL